MQSLSCVCVAVAALLAVTLASPTVVRMEQEPQPAFPGISPNDPPQCLHERCPPSTVVADRGSYKKVYFPPAAYTKLKVSGKKLVPGATELYQRLDKYYDRYNDKKIHMPKTQPAVLRLDVENTNGTVFVPDTFTMFFYLDPSFKDAKHAPKPDDADIQVLDVNSYTMYIRTFSGYPVTYGDWMKELLQLAADVQADGEAYRKEFFYFGTYDKPGALTHRVNEVQLLAVADQKEASHFAPSQLPPF